MKNRYLIVAAMFSGVAAILHLGCIVFGADWYRFLGTGEKIAQMAEAGDIYPTIVTLGISSVLTLWALYALSGAGVIFRLPLLRLSLCCIAAIYSVRGIAFIPMMSLFPSNSLTFWLTSSIICLLGGLLYVLGLKQAWSTLGVSHQ